MIWGMGAIAESLLNSVSWILSTGIAGPNLISVTLTIWFLCGITLNYKSLDYFLLVAMVFDIFVFLKLSCNEDCLQITWPSRAMKAFLIYDCLFCVVLKSLRARMALSWDMLASCVLSFIKISQVHELRRAELSYSIICGSFSLLWKQSLTNSFILHWHD